MWAALNYIFTNFMSLDYFKLQINRQRVEIEIFLSSGWKKENGICLPPSTRETVTLVAFSKPGHKIGNKNKIQINL